MLIFYKIFRLKLWIYSKFFFYWLIIIDSFKSINRNIISIVVLFWNWNIFDLMLFFMVVNIFSLYWLIFYSSFWNIVYIFFGHGNEFRPILSFRRRTRFLFIWTSLNGRLSVQSIRRNSSFKTWNRI